jgi:exopolyphosphatase/guanosine-5'-triphosphate,3'-diphosphate pyrophosphatase
MSMEQAPALDTAVIDIGSNSVRLMVYRLEGRSIWTLYNEKVLAGLGRDMATTGRLSASGVELAMTALRRFRAVVDPMPPGRISAVATAAVRDASDGADFVRRIAAETGLNVRVLTGEEEARYSALGVVAGYPGASGVVGDLGGASLELTELSEGAPGAGLTLPLGPFALGAPGAFDANRVGDRIASQLANVSLRAETFHAVGGAWRNLALIHMKISGYPLEIAHQYQLGANEAADAANFIARQSKGSLERMGGASKKRAEIMPYAAAVLSALLPALGARRVVISAFGLREGLLFDAMPPEVQRSDPLVAGCAALGGRGGEAEALGAALHQWLKPVFSRLPLLFDERDDLLIAAACRLADLGGRLHPDHRADLTFEQVYRAPIAGQSHAERAFLATAVFARHTAVADPPEQPALSRLLSFPAQRRAKALGAAIRLGCDLSGRNPALLAQSALTLDDETIVLTAARHADLLLGDQTKRRAQTFASALGRKLEIRTQT